MMLEFSIQQTKWIGFVNKIDDEKFMWAWKGENKSRWVKVYNSTHHVLYYLETIIRDNTWRRMGRRVYVPEIGDRIPIENCSLVSAGSKIFGRHRWGWEDNIVKDFNWTWNHRPVWMSSLRHQWRALVMQQYNLSFREEHEILRS